MRTTLSLVVSAIVAGVVTFVPLEASAQSVEALRKEIEQLRQQQEQYLKAIDALGERLRRLEAQPAPAPAAPAAATPPAVAQTPGAPTTPTSPSTPLELIRPREPFALYQQRGAGQLLFDIGVTGDFVGNVTQHNVQKANGGTFPGQENRFFPREVELSLFGQVDPYARAEVRIEAGEDTPGTETSLSLAEATITLLTLPYGTQAKLGQLRNRFGWSNIVHEHDLPWVDRPDVYRLFLGADGLKEKGAEVTWVPDLPFYLELLGGVFNGDNETAFGRGLISHPLVTGRARTYFDLSDTSAIQIGASVASGETAERLHSTLLGYDVKYKYRPDGWLHPLLTLSTEGIYSMRRVEATDPATAEGSKHDRDRFGWYAWAEFQPWRRWALGTRFDSTQYPVEPGWQWAVEPYVTFLPSEFLRFRLAYKHTDRDHRDGWDLNGGSARLVDELFLQATFIMGAHPAHAF